MNWVKDKEIQIPHHYNLEGHKNIYFSYSQQPNTVSIRFPQNLHTQTYKQANLSSSPRVMNSKSVEFQSSVITNDVEVDQRFLYLTNFFSFFVFFLFFDKPPFFSTKKEIKKTWRDLV